MEIIAKKSKELQNKTLISMAITLFLAVVLLVVEIVCLNKLGWRKWVDILYILLIIGNLAFSVMEGIQFFQMAKVAEYVIIYEDEGEEKKLTFSGVLSCLPNEVQALSVEISEDSHNGDWGSLHFSVKESAYTCPLIANIQTVFARLVELGATAAEIEETTETEEVVEEVEKVENPEVSEEVTEETKVEE